MSVDSESNFTFTTLPTYPVNWSDPMQQVRADDTNNFHGGPQIGVTHSSKLLELLLLVPVLPWSVETKWKFRIILRMQL